MKAYLVKLAAVAMAYYITGWLGLMLIVPPGQSIAIWPPAGVALAALLLLGYRYWPGVLLGSMGVSAHIFFDQGSASGVLPSAVIAAIIGGGAALQAVVGASLSRRWISFPNSLETARDIGLLLVLGGPLGCLVSATIGVGALALNGSIPWGRIAVGWLTWWVGDIVGIAVFTPVLLLVCIPTALVSGRRKRTVLTALLVSYTVAVGVFVAARHWELERERLEFDKETTIIVSQLGERVRNNSDAVAAAALLYDASDMVSGAQFKTFARGMMEKHPGIRGLTWTPKVAEADRVAFEMAQRRAGHPEFSIVERDSQRQYVPASPRDFHYPVTYIEPELPAIIGFDDNSEAIRRMTLEKARDSGQRQATPRLDVFRKDERLYEILVITPVFLHDKPTATVADRRDNIEGFVMGAFILPELIGSSLDAVKDRDVDVYITDDDSPATRLLYDSRTPDHREAATALPTHGEARHWQQRIEVAGRFWTIHCVQSQAALLAGGNWAVWLALTGGMLFTALISVFSMVTSARADTVRQLVEARTRQIRESELRLKSSEQTFRLAMEHASIGMALVKPGGQWLLVNNALTDLLGYDKETLLASDYQAISHPDDVAADAQSMQQLLDGLLQTYQMEKRYVHRDGHTIWGLLNVSLVRQADGSAQYFVAQIQDISARKHMDRMKSEFIATVSHELRTPLTSIRGSLGLITGGAAGPLPEKAARLLSVAYHNTARLTLIINDILDVEKIESGKMSLTMTDQPLAPLLEQAVEENRGYAQNCRVRLEVRGELPDVRVMVDAGRLLQIAANFLSNAAKFSPVGGLVEIGAERRGESVRIFVSDHGPGIPASFQPLIFQRFCQADGSDSRAKGGTGLGLNIAKSLVEQMGGIIGYETSPQSGTTFYVDLPLTAGHAGAIEEERVSRA